MQNVQETLSVFPERVREKFGSALQRYLDCATKLTYRNGGAVVEEVWVYPASVNKTHVLNVYPVIPRRESPAISRLNGCRHLDLGAAILTSGEEVRLFFNDHLLVPSEGYDHVPKYAIQIYPMGHPKPPSTSG